MIVVSGTGRSGTSMWMQAFAGAGFPVVGEAFPGKWETLIGSANPRGFFESTLIAGINFTTNPDPHSGVFVDPKQSRDFVVKVFLPGLRRTEFRYLDRVLVTTREWRSFCSSALRLEAMQKPTESDEVALSPASLSQEPAIKWWLDHYNLVQDHRRRGFNLAWLTYESVVADPEPVLSKVLSWTGIPHDLQGALRAIDSRLQTQEETTYSCTLNPRWLEVFDTLYERVHRGKEIDPGFQREMDQVHREITKELGPRNSWEDRQP